MSVRLPALSGALDQCCCLANQVLGGEEILQLPKKTEELVPGKPMLFARTSPTAVTRADKNMCLL